MFGGGFSTTLRFWVIGDVSILWNCENCVTCMVKAFSEICHFYPENSRAEFSFLKKKHKNTQTTHSTFIESASKSRPVKLYTHHFFYRFFFIKMTLTTLYWQLIFELPFYAPKIDRPAGGSAEIALFQEINRLICMSWSHRSLNVVCVTNPISNRIVRELELENIASFKLGEYQATGSPVELFKQYGRGSSIGIWILKKVLSDFRTNQTRSQQIETIQYYHRVILFVMSKLRLKVILDYASQLSLVTGLVQNLCENSEADLTLLISHVIL